MEEGPIDRRAPWTDQGHEEDWCLLEKLVRSLKTAVAHFSSTSVDEDQQRNSANGATKQRKQHNKTAQAAQQNSANSATKQRKQRNETNSTNGATKRPKWRNETAQTAQRTTQAAQQNSANSATKRCLHLHCNATNTIATIVTNATNNDDNR